MTTGEDMLQLVSGPKVGRAEAAITAAMDAAISILAESMGGSQQRSAAIRRLLARGIAVDAKLMREAVDRAERERHAE